jgi:hypothetical protein
MGEDGLISFNYHFNFIISPIHLLLGHIDPFNWYQSRVAH